MKMYIIDHKLLKRLVPRNTNIFSYLPPFPGNHRKYTEESN